MIPDSGSEQPAYMTNICLVCVRLLQDPASNYSNQEHPSKFDDGIHFLAWMVAVGRQTQFGSLS
jgi:hypothetical protein